MTYWYGLFDEETWQELLNNGAKVDGFLDGAESTVRKMECGDILVCYCMVIGTWFNAYEITSTYFRSKKRLYKDFCTPNQVDISIKFRNIKPEDGIPVKDTFDKLKFFARMKNQKYWGSFMRTQPRWMDDADGDYLMQQLIKLNAKLNK